MKTLTVSPEVGGARRDLAMDLLQSGTGIVSMMWLTLRPERDHIRAEVVLPSTARRTPEAFEASIKDGIAFLTQSSLAEVAHLSSIRWAVVERRGGVQLWPLS